MKLGIFDSGRGGELVAQKLKELLPRHTYTVVNDLAHAPYGERSYDDIRRLTEAAIQPLLDCDIIVIACNSATTAAIEWLRSRYPEQRFIGIEPMIKPAAELTKTGVITVCATPATLRSEAYQRLKERYAKDLTVMEPDCEAWAQMIEENTMNDEKITEMVESAIAGGSDVIVLGCTHYHWIKEKIVEAACPDVRVLEPSEAIGRRIRTLLGSD